MTANGNHTGYSTMKPVWLKDNGLYTNIPYHLMRHYSSGAPHRGCTGYYIDPADGDEVKAFAMSHPRYFKHTFPGWLELRKKRQSWLSYKLSGRPSGFWLWFAIAMNLIAAGVNFTLTILK